MTEPSFLLTILLEMLDGFIVVETSGFEIGIVI
jgi:hypothetical protein